MTFSAFEIYLLIGVSYWATHVLQCRACRATVWGIGILFIEGAYHTFGWPIRCVEEITLHFHRPTTGLTEEQVAAAMQKEFDRVAESLGAEGLGEGGVKFVELQLEKIEGESEADFKKRLQTEAKEHIRKLRGKTE